MWHIQIFFTKKQPLYFFHCGMENHGMGHLIFKHTPCFAHGSSGQVRHIMWACAGAAVATAQWWIFVENCRLAVGPQLVIDLGYFFLLHLCGENKPQTILMRSYFFKFIVQFKANMSCGDQKINKSICFGPFSSTVCFAIHDTARSFHLCMRSKTWRFVCSSCNGNMAMTDIMNSGPCRGANGLDMLNCHYLANMF